MSQRLIRRIVNALALGLSAVATLVGLLLLGALLWSLLKEGLAHFSMDVLTKMTPPPATGGGGLLNAIYGSAIMTLIGILIGGPVGVMAGTYLAEYGRNARLSTVIRFVNDVLLSAPSIIIGLFVYELVVVPMGNFSAISGAISLAIIAMPVIVRTTEDMLNLVPQGMKDASTAMGAYPWRTIMSIAYPAARSGMMTGLLLAVARISGETAPLLFTALNNQFFSADLTRPIANLPVVIFQFAMSPYENWQKMAWAGVLIAIVFILALSLVSRLVLNRGAIKSRTS